MSEQNGDDTQVDNTGGDVVDPTPEQIAEWKLKAEGYDKLEEENGGLKRDLKKAQRAVEKPSQKETPKETPQSDEVDYAKLAFLRSSEVTHPDDQKIVLEEARRLNLPLTDVLAMEHIKTQLRDSGDQRASESASPDGQGRKGGAQRDTVEYYLQHPDERPTDLEMANKVIDAKMQKEVNASKFSDELFVG